MLLSDILRKLGSGELASYFLGTKDIGVISQEYWPQMIDHLNTALNKLHSKFPLREEQIIIEQVPHITSYTLSSRFAASNTESSEVHKYIIDSMYDPFKDNVIRIEQVYDEAYREMQLNDEDSCCSLFTPKYNVLQVRTPVAYKALFVIYRGDHPKIPVDTTAPETITVDIPDYLEEAVLAYIGHRYLSSKNTEATSNISSRLYAKYMSICSEVQAHNLLRESCGSRNRHPEIQGWI